MQPDPTVGADGVVPVVDIGEWFTGRADDRARIAAEVDLAGRTVGFMQIVGHGVRQHTLDELAGATDSFFALPPDVKGRYRSPRPEVNRGYSPPRSERLSYSLGVVTPDDLFEAFNVGASAADFPEIAGLDPDVYAPNIWPDGAPGFQTAVEAWFAEAGRVARTMTAIFAAALGLPEGFFDRFTDHSIDVLRINHYAVPPGLELAQGQLGMGAHTDYGIVTILWADRVPGLEILRPDGNWLAVVPEPGALLINLGDLTERWTNDRWTSTMHRVVPRDRDGTLVRRRSAAYFHDGNADAVISTLPTCRDAAGGSSYPDVTVADHLAAKLGGSRGLALNTRATREAARVTAASERG